MKKINLAVGKFKLSDIFHQKISFSMFFSYAFFLVAFFLDYYMTNSSSQGDYTMEGNAIGRLWWQIMGPFRFIEFPIWAVAVFITAYLINFKSKPFVLIWLNFLAFQHLFGFSTWLPYETKNFIYNILHLASNYNTSLISILLSLFLVILQTNIKLSKKMRVL